MKPAASSPIKEFWNWFRANERRIFDSAEEPQLWDDIDSKLEEVSPDVGWEFGPVDDSGAKMYFALSPELQDDLLPDVESMINLSYASALWEFRVGRQARPWSDIVQMVSDRAVNEGLREIDLSDWKYVVSPDPDDPQYVDLVFESPSCPLESQDDRDELAVIVAQGLLGELTVLQRVGAIELVKKLEPRLSSQAKPASELPQLFAARLP